VEVMQKVESYKCFGGELERYKHNSHVLGCDMHFHIFLPEKAQHAPCPVLYYLSGLTCSDQNVVQKSFAQKFCADHSIIFIAPDTSPRGLGIPGEEPEWDFGTGAGMYVDATNEPWSRGYKMYTYVTKELPQLVAANIKNVDISRESITGHSMGGHGALICALKNPGRYRSVSAFAPICNASQVPWGIKTFSAYLGDNTESWKTYDACELAQHYQGPDPHILIDQGTQDKFLQEQLSTPKFLQICVTNPNLSSTKVYMREKYDHSYYFVSSFMEDHIMHHAKFLK